ncbi:MAG: O-antigen ligase family protein [Gammaproteobacteria bacterium]|nr:O-antigen ligase family protein [Gammaproteobacteria bacterium]
MSVSFQSMNSGLPLKSNLFKIVSYIGSFFLILFPFSITILPEVHGIVIAVSFVLAAILFLFGGETVSLKTDEKYFFASIFFMIITVVSVSAYAGIDEMVMKKLFKYLYLLLVIPVYYVYRTIKFNYALVWYGLFIGAVVSALYGINQAMLTPLFNVDYAWRAQGVTNAIIYGDISLIMGVLCLSGIGWFKSRAKWQIIYPIIACLMGLVASVLSQSRGGWVAIPFLSLVFLWDQKVYFYKYVSSLAIIVVITIIYIIPQTGVESKLSMTFSNIQMYFDSDIYSRYRQTSIGVRLEAGRAAWLVFVENPFIGVGWGNLQENAKVFVENGMLNKSAITYAHPHNQFLSIMASGGIVATIAVFFLFFVPVKTFYQACKSSELSSDARRIGLAGILFIVGFVIFNMSESFLERSRTVSFFIFYLAVFMAGIRGMNTEEIRNKK